MVALKGDKEIGDKVNKIIARLAEANGLQKVIDQADFNDRRSLARARRCRTASPSAQRHERRDFIWELVVAADKQLRNAIEIP